jgi:hypothetical protein
MVSSVPSHGSKNGVVGLTVCGKISGRVPAEASSLVRLFTRELGDPRGTWANDRHTSHVESADGENASRMPMSRKRTMDRNACAARNNAETIHNELQTSWVSPLGGHGQLLGVDNNYVTVKIRKHSTAHCNRIRGYLIMSTACPAAAPAAREHQ